MNKRIKFLLGLGLIVLFGLILFTNTLLKKYQKQMLSPDMPSSAKTSESAPEEKTTPEASEELPAPVFPKASPALN